MRRRGRGEGSITQRKDGRYQVRVDVGRDELGRRQRRSGYAKTEAEAVKLLRQLQREKEQGRLGARSGAEPRTLGAWLDQWLEHVQQAKEPGTHEKYESIVRLHLRPALGHLRRSQFQPVLVQRMLDAKLREGYSPAYVRLMQSTLSAALKSANKLFGWPNFASLNLIELPPAAPAEENILTLAEGRRFLAGIRGDPLYALYLLSLALGQRQGTMLGLRWPDVAEDYSRIRLPMRLVRVKGAWQLRPHRVSRTKKAPRSLPLPGPVADALRQHRGLQQAQREMAGSAWVVFESGGKEVELVFTTPTGGPLNGSGVTHRFQRALARAGLDRRRFHDLRHSAATIMLVLKVPLKVVSEVLAHAGIQITGDLYGHVQDEHLVEQLRVLDAAWGDQESAG